MNRKRISTLLFSTAGLAAMFLIVVAVNFLATLAKARVDLTAEKLYTLSDGTRAVLGKLDGTVEVRFYCSRGEREMPVVLKTYAQRVEDLLNEYQQHSRGNLELKKYDPEPDSDAEDLATRDGVDGQFLPSGEKLYLGLAVSFLDRKAVIPFLAPDKEKLLEYELTRAISSVLTADKPVIGVMSPLPLFGQAMNPMMMQMGQRGEPAWAVISELQQNFTVEQVDMNTDRIDPRFKVLLVVHPKGITDAAQYALDQFILGGGKVIAFLDPQCLVDRAGAHPQFGNMGGGSSLDKLLKAWGVNFDSSKVVADRDNMSRVMRGNKAESAPAFLSLNEESIDREDVLTMQLDSLMIPFGGAFTGTPAEGLKRTVLVHSSKNSQLAEGFLAQMSGEQVLKDFKSADTEYAMAIRLTGKFKTAFPEGKPKPAAPAEPDAAKPEEKKDEKADGGSLKESKAENSVLLVGDADWVYDQFAVRSQNVMGFRIQEPLNGNLSLVQNMVELFAGDSNLISVRSRASMTRPFTRINKMETQAEAAYQNKIKDLEAGLQEAQQKLNELQRNKDKGQKFILSKEQQAEIEKFREKEVQVKKELKLVRKQLRQDIESLQFKLKIANIAGMPFLVVLAGIGIALLKRKRTAAR
jgi:ABC-type uncharacterized transport system involved in gliding motility auxiliary subunit